jgi:arylsulfatase
MFNLRMDPFEHAQISGAEYDEWRNDNGYVAFEGNRRTAAFLQTFLQYPPSQLPASFSVNQITEGINKRIEQMQQQRH